MKRIFALVCVTLIAVPILAAGGQSDPSYGDDNDFAEFDDFDADDDFVQVTTQKQDSESIKRAENKQSVDNERNDDFAEIYENDDADDADGIVEEEDSEFEHFADEEEFEGFNKAETTPPSVDQTTGEPKLTMAKVPLHFRCVQFYWRPSNC